MSRLGMALPSRVGLVDPMARAGLMVVYLGVLYHLMVKFIAPTYTYLGYTYEAPDPLLNAVILGFVLLLTVLMPRRIDRVSHFVLWVHFLLATVPSMVVPQFTEQLDQSTAFRFGIAVGIAWSGVLAALSQWTRTGLARVAGHLGRAHPWALGRPWTTRLGFRRGTVAIALASLFIDAVLVAIFGLSGELAGLTQVRDVRLGYREAVGDAPPGTAYLVLLASNVLNPMVMARSLVERRWPLFAVGVFGQVLVYATAGYKMVLLSIPAVVAVHAWLSRPVWARGVVVMGGLVGVMATAWVTFVSWGSTTLPFLFVMRAVVAPGNLSAAYVAIFQGHDPLYWSYSFLDRFLDYPYDLTPNYLVGALFRGDPEVSANVNLFGDGYMALRWGGIAVECVVLVAVLLVLDRVSREFSIGEVCAVLLVPTFALSNSNVFTSLTTHGLLAAVVLLAVVEPSRSPPSSLTHRAPRLPWPLPWPRHTRRGQSRQEAAGQDDPAQKEV
jgi:hypothetical protein